MANDQNGIVQEYVTYILKKNNLKAVISTYPWSRAIQLANEGIFAHGLLTAVPSEAPDFLLTKTPIMTYQVCFFSYDEFNWQYQNPTDLNELQGRLGVIADYGYGGPLDRFIAAPENINKIHFAKGGNATDQLLRMLLVNRITVMAEDKNIIAWHFTEHDKGKPEPKNIGCLAEQPFFLALNPNLPWSRSLIDLLDQEFAQPDNLEVLQHIIASYIPQPADLTQ